MAANYCKKYIEKSRPSVGMLYLLIASRYSIATAGSWDNRKPHAVELLHIAVLCHHTLALTVDVLRDYPCTIRDVEAIREIWRWIIEQDGYKDAMGMFGGFLEFSESPCRHITYEKDILNQLQVLETISQTLTLAEERLSPTSKSSDYFAVDIKSMEPEISAMSSELDSEVFSGLAEILKKVVEDRERMRENQIEIIRKSVKVAAEDFLKSVKPPSFPETVAQKINSLKQKHGPMPSMKDSVNSLETLCKDLFGKFESVLIEKAIESANPPQDTQGDSSNLNSNAFPALLSSNPDMVSEVPRKRVENIGALPEMVGRNPQLQSTSKKLPPQLQHLLNLKHVEKAFNLAATEYSDEEALDQLCREVVPDRSGANSKLESTLKEFVIWFSSHNNYSD